MKKTKIKPFKSQPADFSGFVSVAGIFNLGPQEIQLSDSVIWPVRTHPTMKFKIVTIAPGKKPIWINSFYNAGVLAFKILLTYFPGLILPAEFLNL